MDKTPVYRFLVVGVIVLFVGMGVQPAFAVDVSTSISDNEEECDVCPSVKVKYTGMNDPICTIIFFISFYMGLRFALVGTIYNLLSLMPFNTLFTIYKEYASIRNSFFWDIYMNILNPLYWKYECDYWPY